MNNQNNKSTDETKVCSICGESYKQSIFSTARQHEDCPACHQLYARIKNLYRKKGLDVQLRFSVDNNIPIFIPTYKNGYSVTDNPAELIPLPQPITVQEAIEFLKSNNYKILKPTYIEI